MRDKRYIAEHRGGPLKKEQHRQLILWSCECVEHILTLVPGRLDERLTNALSIAKAWANGKASVGDARKAAVECIGLANESHDPVAIAVARAAGHAVATAHMADHSLGGAIYALKAIKSAHGLLQEERNWQNAQLPEEIRELVLSSRYNKEQGFKDLRDTLPRT